MKKILKITTTILFLILGAGLFSIKTKAIPLSPDKYFLDVENGRIKNDQLLIYGREQLSEEREVYISVVGMKKVGEENEREFYTVNPSDTDEPANWITLSQEKALIKPGQTAVIPWSVKISENATCGTNLAAIMVSYEPLELENEGSSSKVKVNRQIISQVHLNVIRNSQGICQNSINMELVEFKVDRFLPFFSHSNIPFTTKIKNNGNEIARNPQGFITISGFGVNDKNKSIEFNSEKLDIYANTTRKFSNKWAEEGYPTDGNILSKSIYEITHPKFGRYKAQLGVTTAGADSQIIREVTFWIIPWKLILLLLLIILPISGGVYYNLKKNKK